MDAECFRLRRHSKQLEKRYRKLGSFTDRLEWVQHERHRHKIYRLKESTYWNLRLSADSSSSQKLWRSLSSSRTKQMSKAVPTAQQLLDFFNAKVNAVRQSAGNTPVQSTLGPSPVVFEKFDECPASVVARTINSSQSETCELDPIPSDILKQFLPELLPYITDMCNASLQEGCLPASQRRAS